MLGPAGSAKSLFMTEACDRLKGWYYLDASTLSGRGFIEFLEMHQNVKVICLDEIDNSLRGIKHVCITFLNPDA